MICIFRPRQKDKLNYSPNVNKKTIEREIKKEQYNKNKQINKRCKC